MALTAKQEMMEMIDRKFSDMEMMRDCDLTDSQCEAINVLLIKRDWEETTALMKAGANPASLLNLVKRGMAEKRDSTSAKGFPCLEFRFSRDYYTEDGMLKVWYGTHS